MGPPLRSFAADAHDCIMVRVLRPTGYKVVARLIAPASGLPSDRHPDRTKRAVVLEAVKVWPGDGGACRKVGATANLDSFCARQRERSVGRDEETALRSNQETDEGRDAPTCRPLKRRVLTKAHTRKPRRMWRGGASGAMGIWTLPVFCRGRLAAFSAGDRGCDEAGRSIAMGRIGVARRKWNDTATIVSSATASMVISDR